MNLALEFSNVVVRYGRTRALDGLTLRVPSGSVIGLVGSNGAGKTTALCAAAGLLKVNSGRVDLLGRGPFKPAVHAGRLSLLPQDAQMAGHSRVRDILMYYGRLQGESKAALTHDVERLLDRVHLADRAGARIRALSHGMRRRLSIAQAFLGDPDIVLLDEPLNGLDPYEVAETRTFFSDKRAEQTIVISSHLLDQVEAVCDEVAFIERGRTTRQDRLESVTRRKHSLVYRIGAGSPPVDAIRDALKETGVEVHAYNDQVIITNESKEMDAAEINARVLPCLLEAGVGVHEIIQGLKLEDEYLKSRARVHGVNS
jgi:ABC-2 type transport system ATP-binding protein